MLGVWDSLSHNQNLIVIHVIKCSASFENSYHIYIYMFLIKEIVRTERTVRTETAKLFEPSEKLFQSISSLLS